MHPDELRQRADDERQRQQTLGCRLFCCSSTGCLSSGAQEVLDALADAAQAHDLTDQVEIVPTGCMGLCSEGPLVRVEVRDQAPVLYHSVGPLLARLIIVEHVAPALTGEGPTQVPRLLADHHLPLDLPFFSKQHKVVLANAGEVDPANIDHYLARDGYTALAAVLAAGNPQQVIDDIAASGLRGRGGAGYPTASKWRNTRLASGEQKCVICNGDEGDPGAYMDRSILEGDPHAVLEGMMIAAFSIGAQTGWFYIRAEYGLAIERVTVALRQARKQGLLGKNILGSGFDFNCDIRLGAGAFVCGEETALIASIEGRRGTPRPRPPYPSDAGLWEQPSCVNNVETLANIAPILRRGPQWFADMGHGASAGTKVFALTGKIRHGGLIEVPMGITLREIVEELAGGAAGSGALTAVQTGGPSGGMIPAHLFDTPVSYETLQELGSIMGSGGMIVLDQADNMVDLAAFYLEFTVEESCGKCAPCRIGGTQMLAVLRRFQARTASADDLVLLRRLARAMQQASLCGLGQTAPNPVLSTLTYFEEAYHKAMAKTSES